MSDELGSKKDTNNTVGEHVDDAEQAASEHRSTADAEPGRAAASLNDDGAVDSEANAPAGAEEITRPGGTPETTEFRAAGAEPDVIAPNSAEGDDTPAFRAAAAEHDGATPEAGHDAPASDTAPDARGTATPDEPAEEPDYEALAAELDRLEADTAAAAPVAPGAREPEPADRAADPWFEPAQTETFSASEPAQTTATSFDEPAEPAQEGSQVTPAPGPIFVQAPEPPRPRGNRGAAGLIGLLAAVAFGVLYAAAAYLWQIFVAAVPSIEAEAVLDPLAFATDVLLQPSFWFTVVAFWLSFWLLGVFVNRARWWSWVVLGLIVALLTYVGHIAGAFLAAPFWNITPSEGTDLLLNVVFTPMALAAIIIAREVTIWFGAWVSRRGARVTVQNQVERDEYERLMSEGPKAP